MTERQKIVETEQKKIISLLQCVSHFLQDRKKTALTVSSCRAPVEMLSKTWYSLVFLRLCVMDIPILVFTAVTECQ